MTSAGRFGKSLKRLYRRVKGWKYRSFPFGKHVILYLSFEKKQSMFEMKICNNDYMVRQRMTILMGEVSMD